MPRNKADAVFAAALIAKEFAEATAGIDPAGQAVVGAAEQGNAILNGTERSTGGVLPLGRAVAEPAVVGEINKEVGVVIDRFADEMPERVLEANQGSGLDGAVGRDYRRAVG